jgi:hypothetical protein
MQVPREKRNFNQNVAGNLLFKTLLTSVILRQELPESENLLDFIQRTVVWLSDQKNGGKFR